MKSIKVMFVLFIACALFLIVLAARNEMKKIRDCQAINNFEYGSCRGKLR